MTVGRGSQVSPLSLKGEHACVGRGSRVHSQARLAGTTVVGDGCLIDAQASITDSVVLPGTYVGENVEIGNAIVNGNQIMRVDSGASYRVADRFLLSDFGQAQWLQARDRALCEAWSVALAAAAGVTQRIPINPLTGAPYLLRKKEGEIIVERILPVAAGPLVIRLPRRN